MEISHKIRFLENAYFFRKIEKNPFYERIPLIFGHFRPLACPLFMSVINSVVSVLLPMAIIV